MTDRELIQQALDALDYEAERGYDDGYRQLRDALRDRLAQPEQCQYPQCQCATESPCLKGLAQQEQEPVFDCPRCGHCCPPQGIYYTPPQRKPLTDEEIDALVIDKDGLPNSHLEFARAIEAAHGIKGDA